MSARITVSFWHDNPKSRRKTAWHPARKAIHIAYSVMASWVIHRDEYDPTNQGIQLLTEIVVTRVAIATEYMPAYRFLMALLAVSHTFATMKASKYVFSMSLHNQDDRIRAFTEVWKAVTHPSWSQSKLDLSVLNFVRYDHNLYGEWQMPQSTNSLWACTNTAVTSPSQPYTMCFLGSLSFASLEIHRLH